MITAAQVIDEVEDVPNQSSPIEAVDSENGDYVELVWIDGSNNPHPVCSIPKRPRP